MRLPFRHILWFTAAVLAPCLGLVLLTVRLLNEEQQLASRRVRENAERQLDNARRTLEADLEPYRLGQAPAAFRGTIRDGRILLPWDEPTASNDIGRLEHAVQSRDPQAFELLANLPPSNVDDQAVPIALYAIPHLAANKAPAAIRSFAAKMLADPYRFSPVALHLLRSLSAGPEYRSLAPAIDAAIVNAEAAERFQADHPRIADANPARWLSWGSPLFLIGFASAPERGELVFRAVPAAQVSTRVTLDRGQLLGESFPRLRIALPDIAPEREVFGRPLLLSMLGLILVIALLGGTLLWRDFERGQELAKLRTQFIASVSHELRTPLTAIRMFVESLKMNPDLDVGTRSDYLDTMLRETERLSRLVGNVLEFSRIERDRKTYSLHPVALSQVVDSVITCFGPVVEHAGYRLRATKDPDLPEVRADADALQQAIVNLLSNAMKYSGSSREIELSVRRREKLAEVLVRDFGVGIAVPDQARIFEPFYRAESIENHSIQGAGLGLAVVRHVIRGHGGEILLESAPGQGSTFRLLLPICPSC
jgi:signal transduction histidine kinase